MMHTYAGLYYPFIHFKDESWLKMCALYWDSMSRIVPDGYEPEDGATVTDLKTFVQPVAPHWVRPDFAEGFATFAVTHAHTLRARYGLHDKDSWDHVPELQRPPKPGGPSGTDPRLGYVFVDKLPWVATRWSD